MNFSNLAKNILFTGTTLLTLGSLSNVYADITKAEQKNVDKVVKEWRDKVSFDTKYHIPDNFNIQDLEIKYNLKNFSTIRNLGIADEVAASVNKIRTSSTHRDDAKALDELFNSVADQIDGKDKGNLYFEQGKILDQDLKTNLIDDFNLLGIPINKPISAPLNRTIKKNAHSRGTVVNYLLKAAENGCDKDIIGYVTESKRLDNLVKTKRKERIFRNALGDAYYAGDQNSLAAVQYAKAANIKKPRELKTLTNAVDASLKAAREVPESKDKYLENAILFTEEALNNHRVETSNDQRGLSGVEAGYRRGASKVAQFINRIKDGKRSDPEKKLYTRDAKQAEKFMTKLDTFASSFQYITTNSDSLDNITKSYNNNAITTIYAHAGIKNYENTALVNKILNRITVPDVKNSTFEEFINKVQGDKYMPSRMKAKATNLEIKYHKKL